MTVEDARVLARRLYLNKPSAKVTVVESGSRHFELIPKLRRMRHRVLEPAGLASSPSLVAVSLTNQKLDEEILEKLAYEAPRSIGFQIYSLSLGRASRARDSVWDSDGALIGLVRRHDLALIDTSMSVALGSLVASGKLTVEKAIAAYRDVACATGCEALDFFQSDERKPVVRIGAGVRVFRPSSPERPLDVVLYDDPEQESGLHDARCCYRLGFESFSRSITKEWGAAWPLLRAGWETARKHPPKGDEIWEVQLSPQIEKWDEAREWINANIPGPFEGPISIGMETDAVDEVLKNEAEEGQYIEVYWKRILGSEVLVSAIRHRDGWAFQANTHVEVKEDKALKLRDEIAKICGYPHFLSV